MYVERTWYASVSLLCKLFRESFAQNPSIFRVVSAMSIILDLSVERVQVRPGMVARRGLVDRRFCGCGESKESPGNPERQVVPHAAGGVEVHQHY